MFFPVGKESHAIFYVPPNKKWVHQIVLLCCISPACAIARPKPHQCRQHFKFNLLEELLPLFHPFWLALDSSIHFTTGERKSTASTLAFAFNTFQLSNAKLCGFCTFPKSASSTAWCSFAISAKRLVLSHTKISGFSTKKRWQPMERSIAFPGAPFNSLYPPWMRE